MPQILIATDLKSESSCSAEQLSLKLSLGATSSRDVVSRSQASHSPCFEPRVCRPPAGLLQGDLPLHPGDVHQLLRPQVDGHPDPHENMRRLVSIN